MQYRSEIDGLRAVAVLAVIIFHVEPSLLTGGFLGVDIFFIISGFLITSIIIKQESDKQFSLISFYKRRIKRIVPALVFMMAFFIPISWFLLLPNELKQFGKSLVSSFFSFSNITFWREGGDGYFAEVTIKPLLHTWSLGIEEQFYLIFPVILMVLLRFLRRWTLIIGLISLITSFILANYLSITHSNFSFFMIFSRFWELLIGGLLGYVLFNYKLKLLQLPLRWFSTIGFILIVSSFIFMNKTLLHPSFYTLIPVIGVCLIVLFNTEHSIENKLLKNKWMVFIGLLSYSLYLWHYPLLVFYKDYRLFNNNNLGKSIVIGLTFIFAYLSWRFVEQPFRNGKWTCKKRWVFFIVSLIVLVYGSACYINKGFESRLSIFEQNIIAFKKDYNLSRTECGYYSKGNKLLSKACVLGGKSNVVGALIGDSHAEALSFSLSKKLQEENMGVMNFWYSGCPPIMEIKYLKNKHHKCAIHNNNIYFFLKKYSKFNTVILHGRYSAYFKEKGFDNKEGGIERKGSNDKSVNIEDINNIKLSEQQRKINIKKKMIKTIEGYLSLGKNIVLVYPVPEVGWNAPDEAVKRSFQPFTSNSHKNVSTSYQVFKKRNKDVIDILDAVGKHKNLKRVYPHKILCDTFIKDRCVAVLNGKSFYHDDDHLSIYGSEFVTPKIIEAIKSFD